MRHDAPIIGEMEGIQPGPYFATWGPRDGPIRQRERPPALGVVPEAEAPWPIVGTAYPWGWVAHWRGPVATFRLAIGKSPIPGLYVVDGRRFVPVEVWEAVPAEP